MRERQTHLDLVREPGIHSDAPHLTYVHSQGPVTPRAVQAKKYAEIRTRPRRICRWGQCVRKAVNPANCPLTLPTWFPLAHAFGGKAIMRGLRCKRTTHTAIGAKRVLWLLYQLLKDLVVDFIQGARIILAHGGFTATAMSRQP
jgi:hypothetical protein